MRLAIVHQPPDGRSPTFDRAFGEQRAGGTIDPRSRNAIPSVVRSVNGDWELR